jgi:hypothetical protein
MRWNPKRGKEGHRSSSLVGPAATAAVGVSTAAVGVSTAAVGVSTATVGVSTAAVGVNTAAVGVITGGVAIVWDPSAFALCKCSARHFTLRAKHRMRAGMQPKQCEYMRSCLLQHGEGGESLVRVHA